MNTDIYPRSVQPDGMFDGGAILEKKPLGFPQDGGKLKPYSNLFYWAHAWSEDGGLIEEHPHQGFEIMTFVLNGELEHYDSKQQGWNSLKAGDVQIIRAGSGISHAEKMHPGTSFFQIWFDPGLKTTLSQPATYNDYLGNAFSVKREGGQLVPSDHAAHLVARKQFEVLLHFGHLTRVQNRVGHCQFRIAKASTILQGAKRASGHQTKQNLWQ